MSIATALPTIRVSRGVPPAPGIGPIAVLVGAIGPYEVQDLSGPDIAHANRERMGGEEKPGIRDIAIAAEIVPVAVPLGRGKVAKVVQDEHPRATTREDLGRLRSITWPDGSVTAGNASGVNDGAAALIVASASVLPMAMRG